MEFFVKYLKYVLSIVFTCQLLCTQKCFADRYIQPVKNEGQEEVLIQGGSVLVSQKKHTVLMYQTSEVTSGKRANFYIALMNKGAQSVNVLFHHLRVTDQHGKFVRVLPKEELIANKKSSADWKTAFCSLDASLKAQDAGKTDVYTHTNTTNVYHTNTLSPQGMHGQSHVSHGTSSAHTVVYSELARQQALREIQNEAIETTDQIAQEYAYWENGLSSYYFDSNTVLPNTTYGGNIQIEIPTKVDKNIEYLVFNLYVENEVHTFYFYCGHEKEKKWYQFW